MSGNEDLCEYVTQPLLRQLQAMSRLMNMMRDSQMSNECNDIQCFNEDNPLMQPSQQNSSMMSVYGPMMLAWALFILVLFILRPSSMRGDSSRQRDADKSSRNGFSRNNNNYYEDDDDDSAIH